jgi:hypothetical protein
MTIEETYQLIGYEIETNREVLNWRSVAPTRRFHRGDVIEDGVMRWQIIGVRRTSTQYIWLVDLKGITTPTGGSNDDH